MRAYFRGTTGFTLLTAASLCLCASSAFSHPQLLGVGQLPGNGTDLSGLADTLEDGTPHNRLRAFGSGSAYTG